MTIKYLCIAAASMLFMLAGCGTPTVEQVPTPPPTIAAAATKAAPAIATAATQAAPVIQTAAPTVAAAATQAAPAAATAAAASPLQIVDVRLDPVDPRVEVRNTSAAAIDMSGWTFQVGTASATLPANAVVRPGETVRLHLSEGTSTGTDIYLGAVAMTLVEGLQPGARVALVDNQGRTVSEFRIPG